MWNTVKVKTLDNIVSHGLVKIHQWRELKVGSTLKPFSLSLSLPPSPLTCLPLPFSLSLLVILSHHQSIEVTLAGSQSKCLFQLDLCLAVISIYELILNLGQLISDSNSYIDLMNHWLLVSNSLCMYLCFYWNHHTY